ncbi:hypothetical protein [Candidatus Palauibacter sp.]|uniref:hypothetical protein n=1 Tax=Candidatus Palauibacter sp. TaxID=3101350 RepID=UPI003B51B974
MSVFFFVIMIVALVTFGKVVSKLVDARSAPPALEPGRETEIESLREQVALLAGEVDRLTEEQRFMTRLLETDVPRQQRRPDSRLGGSN